MRLPQPARRGFSLLELLTVLTIVSLLFSLLLPAIVQSVESSRNVRCQANLKQIGVALHAFEGAKGSLPGVKGEGCALSGISVSAQIYPFLTGEDALNELISNRCKNGGDMDKNIGASAPSVLHCPSDGGAYGAAVSYRFNGTLVPFSSKLGPFFGWPPRETGLGNTLAEIGDGLAQTAFASERMVYRLGETNDSEALLAMWNGSDYFKCEKLNREPSVELLEESAGTKWLSAAASHSKYSHRWPPNMGWRDCGIPGENGAQIAARSRHPGHVNVLMGDGSVKPTGNHIDLAVWRALGSMNSSETVSETRL